MDCSAEYSAVPRFTFTDPEEGRETKDSSGDDVKHAGLPTALSCPVCLQHAL